MLHRLHPSWANSLLPHAHPTSTQHSINQSRAKSCIRLAHWLCCRLYGINVCGEGGEYESLTLDCPMFRCGRIVLDGWEKVIVSGDSMAPVALLHPTAFHVEAKGERGPGGTEAGSVNPQASQQQQQQQGQQLQEEGQEGGAGGEGLAAVTGEVIEVGLAVWSLESGSPSLRPHRRRALGRNGQLAACTGGWHVLCCAVCRGEGGTCTCGCRKPYSVVLAHSPAGA